VTITPDGKIYSCALFIGRGETYETGHISKNERGGLDTLMNTFVYPDECRKCTYLPICANCRADALSATGDLLGANTQKARYEQMMPQLIRAHYDLQTQKKGGGNRGS
jgi:radical SAM protein with 4Fe4S-binding SPASM domain